MNKFCKNFLLCYSIIACLCFFKINGIQAQNCTITGSGGGGTNITQAQVLGATCLGSGACPCILTITGGQVNISGNWNLVSKGNITIRVDGPGSFLHFPNNEQLFLTAGSSIQLLNGGMLSYNGTASDIKITKGTVTYNGTSFTQINSGLGVLPVELANFEGKLTQQAIFLSWQTSAELNNSKFIIETSTEGEVFNRIGEIAGAGTSTETHNYQFTHHTPSAGVNYYRLKQVDFDGSFAYSKVLAIDAPGSKDIFAFPNPAKDKITLQYDYSKGTGNIQLYDALGRRINASIAGYAGNYDIKLPEGLAKGTYWLKVERGGQVQTVAVVKE